ncbi:MAG TPA: hypothetical protein VM364_04680 [Vicinamibacterales bacterium]|nr:hypothetical protein [Vicinamibacterales bacterium]
MSIAIAVHCGSYVLLATDCRESIIARDGSIEPDTDTLVEKIKRTSAGFITGTGLGPLLFDVRDQIIESQPANIKALRDLIRSAREAFRDDESRSESLRTVTLAQTGWILTSTSRHGVELLIYHPDSGNEIARYAPGGFALFVPLLSEGDEPERVGEIVGTAIEEQLRMGDPDATKEELQRDLSWNVDLLRHSIARAASEVPTVSQECHIAVHFHTGDRHLSEMVTPGQPLAWIEIQDERDEHDD